ncbi:MAG TPA: hypothetical protein VG826_35585 [Pirellulales bacterium]|nr:hypothetical protein [Pirellulales bacterium]
MSAGHWTYRELQRVVDLMGSHGDRGKVWATEVGYLPYAGPMLCYELVDGQLLRAR